MIDYLSGLAEQAANPVSAVRPALRPLFGNQPVGWDSSPTEPQAVDADVSSFEGTSLIDKFTNAEPTRIQDGTNTWEEDQQVTAKNVGPENPHKPVVWDSIPTLNQQPADRDSISIKLQQPLAPLEWPSSMPAGAIPRETTVISRPEDESAIEQPLSPTTTQVLGSPDTAPKPANMPVTFEEESPTVDRTKLNRKLPTPSLVLPISNLDTVGFPTETTPRIQDRPKVGLHQAPIDERPQTMPLPKVSVVDFNLPTLTKLSSQPNAVDSIKSSKSETPGTDAHVQKPLKPRGDVGPVWFETSHVPLSRERVNQEPLVTSEPVSRGSADKQFQRSSQRALETETSAHKLPELRDQQPSVREVHSKREAPPLAATAKIIPMAATAMVPSQKVRSQPINSLAAQSHPETSVYVTIGRVEVRATVTNQKPTGKREPSSRPSSHSLEDYLRGTSSGRSS